jgi:hypothetical protein
MIRELADFEHELEQVDITPQDLQRDGFGANGLTQVFTHLLQTGMVNRQHTRFISLPTRRGKAVAACS